VHSASKSNSAEKASLAAQEQKQEDLEQEAIVGFSRAIADGVNVMELPDGPEKKDPELSDELANMVYSADISTEREITAVPMSTSQKVKAELEH
jgi:hypothetical protein